MRYSEINESNLKLIPGDLPRVRGSYGAFIITMLPMDFLKLTAPEEDMKRIMSRSFPQDQDSFEQSHGSKENFNRFPIPFLIVEWPTGRVVGHEGRHRAWMIHQQGGTNFPVVIYLRHQNEYSVSYHRYDCDTEDTDVQTEEFGTDYEGARARAEELEGHNQKARDAWQHAWDNDDLTHEDEKYSISKVRVQTHRLGDIKGSPNYVNPEDPWDRKPYQTDDMPKQLLGQYDDNVVVTQYRVGRVKGYNHFR